MVDGKNVVVVYNKSDICEPDTEVAKKLGIPTVTMSAKSGEGVERLADVVKAVTGTAHLDGTAAVYLNERQRNCATRALKFVVEAKDALDLGLTVDAVGVCIDGALAALMELTGEKVTDRVADEVFSHFCVGK
ncbi:MAG: tRNA uridine-5-carboxymethylaminomethyl(34) synthesis GTPase MnmE, partial [Clostridia bacterium]|nr:tRNA uridine-5-carboxymethylaminomethyl(34) synthesis GTPase MnmE [Clostridia bacterium]